MSTFIVISILLLPLLSIVIGWMWMRGHYPKRRNAICGYRTALSMQNEDTWKFSQELFGRVSWWCGWALLAASLLATLVLCHWGVYIQDIMVYFMVGQVGLCVLPAYAIVERALRRRFRSDLKTRSQVDKDQHRHKAGTYVAFILSVLLLPVVCIIVGWMGMNGMFPESVNGTYGYRSALSMQSQEAWSFAQIYFGQMLWRTGWILLTMTCAFAVFLMRMHRKGFFLWAMSIILCFVQFISLVVLTVFPVENALRQNFGDKKEQKETNNEI